MKKMLNIAAIGCLTGLLTSCSAYGSFHNSTIASQFSNANVQVVEKGQQLTLILPAEITFAPGRTKLNPQVYPLLIKVADIIMKDYPNAQVHVAAYTDTSGNPQRNRSLSITRARAVAGYLRYRGVNRDQLNASGFGENRPVAANDTAAGRAKNRRIEITITNT